MQYRLKHRSRQCSGLVRACQIVRFLTSRVYVGYLEMLRYGQAVMQESAYHAVQCGTDFGITHMGYHIALADDVSDFPAGRENARTG